MRLIDADLWIEKLKNSFATPNYHPDLGDAFQCMEAEQHNEDIEDLIMRIEEQPVAYDVDKVVNEIKMLRHPYTTFEQGFGNLNAYDFYINKAIEIVKGGIQ